MSEEQKNPEVETTEQPKEKTFTEELEVAGSQLVERVQELVKEGNVRKLVIRTADDKELLLSLIHI